MGSLKKRISIYSDAMKNKFILFKNIFRKYKKEGKIRNLIELL